MALEPSRGASPSQNTAQKSRRSSSSFSQRGWDKPGFVEPRGGMNPAQQRCWHLNQPEIKRDQKMTPDPRLTTPKAVQRPGIIPHNQAEKAAQEEKSQGNFCWAVFACSEEGRAQSVWISRRVIKPGPRTKAADEERDWI